MNLDNLSKIPYKIGRIWFNRALISKDFGELNYIRKELDI